VAPPDQALDRLCRPGRRLAPCLPPGQRPVPLAPARPPDDRLSQGPPGRRQVGRQGVRRPWSRRRSPSCASGWAPTGSGPRTPSRARSTTPPTRTSAWASRTASASRSCRSTRTSRSSCRSAPAVAGGLLARHGPRRPQGADGAHQHRKQLEDNAGRLLGFHLHDVDLDGHDHQAIGTGAIDFEMVRGFFRPEHLFVIELSPRVPVEGVLASKVLSRYSRSLTRRATRWLPTQPGAPIPPLRTSAPRRLRRGPSRCPREALTRLSLSRCPRETTRRRSRASATRRARPS
jgi:hypothetical protein